MLDFNVLGLWAKRNACGANAQLDAANGRGVRRVELTGAMLLALLRAWNPERDTAIIIRLDGRRNIEIGQRDLGVMLGREIQKILPHNGVVTDFFLMPVTEDQ